MLEKARSHDQTGITYIHIPAEYASFESEEFDLVVSSFLLHYIEDIAPVISKIHEWLRPGGMYVFSMEHPVGTSSQGRLDSPWLEDENGDRIGYKMTDYMDEGRAGLKVVCRWCSEVPQNHSDDCQHANRCRVQDHAYA